MKTVLYVLRLAEGEKHFRKICLETKICEQMQYFSETGDMISFPRSSLALHSCEQKLVEPKTRTDNRTVRKGQRIAEQQVRAGPGTKGRRQVGVQKNQLALLPSVASMTMS